MRVQQCQIPNSWLKNSNDSLQSIYAYLVSIGGDSLIDTGGLGTKRSGLLANTVSEGGMAFWAKDKDTLASGLRAAGAGDRAYKPEFSLHGTNGEALTAVVFSWNTGSIRNQSKLSAALLTLGHNAKTRILKNDHLQSVSANVERVSRDGKMIHRGAAVYVCGASVNLFAPRVRTDTVKLHGERFKCARSIDVRRLGDLVSSCSL